MNERQKPGPKPRGKARISRGISFRADHFEWLDQYEDRSAVVQKALSILITPELLHAAKSALEILSQPAIFPQDIEAVRKMLAEVIKKSETV